VKKVFFQNPILVVSLFTAIAVVATEVPVWISFFSLALIFWKFLSERQIVGPVPAVIPPVLGFMVFIAVYIQYRTFWGQEESTSVLLGLVSVTILNFKTERDHQFLVLLGFIIVTIKAVFNIDLIWAPPSFIAFLGLWLSLVKNDKISKFKFMFWQIVKSIPLMVLLFFLFPRIVIFQSNKIQNKKAKVGFSDTLRPGLIEQIAGDTTLVFRAEFTNQIYLSTNEIYWRGAVLDYSNNFEWSKGESFRLPAIKGFTGAKIPYRIVLEPSSSKVIFALDSLTRMYDSKNNIEQSDDYTFHTTNFIDQQQFQYEAESLLATGFKVLPGEEDTDSVNLQISNLPPLTKKWVDETKAKNKTANQRLTALKDFFSNPRFVYTLNPGTYKNMDEFLFSRFKGFCEHYATAYATLARALGIPARVVVGYQGGAYNAAGGFWRISSKDAHAWTEVAVNGTWQRVDPTEWVAPLRLNIGGAQFESLSEVDQILYSRSTNWHREEGLLKYWDDLSLILENLNYKWSIFLLTFDKEAQLSFLKDIGNEWPSVTLIVALLGTLIIITIRRRPSFVGVALTPTSRLMLFIDYKATQFGIPIANSNTPLATLNILKELFNDPENLIERFKNEYCAVIYQNQSPTQSIKNWKKEWTHFFDSKNLKADLTDH